MHLVLDAIVNLYSTKQFPKKTGKEYAWLNNMAKDQIRRGRFLAAAN